MPKSDNLNKMTKFLENILPKWHKLEYLNCDIFILKIEFIIEILLTSVGFATSGASQVRSETGPPTQGAGRG